MLTECHQQLPARTRDHNWQNWNDLGSILISGLTSIGQSLLCIDHWETRIKVEGTCRSILRARLTAPAAFLTHLGSHPSPVIQALSALAVEILQSFPRSTAFKVRFNHCLTSRLLGLIQLDHCIGRADFPSFAERMANASAKGVLTS